MPHRSFVVFILFHCCRTLIKGTWMVALSKRHTVVIVATTGFWTGIYSVNKSTWDPWMSGISDMSHPSIKASTKRGGWHTTIPHGRPLLGLSARFVAFNSCTCKALVVCWNNPMVPQNRFMIHRVNLTFWCKSPSRTGTRLLPEFSCKGNKWSKEVRFPPLTHSKQEIARMIKGTLARPMYRNVLSWRLNWFFRFSKGQVITDLVSQLLPSYRNDDVSVVILWLRSIALAVS